MNTYSDAQLVVDREVAGLLDRARADEPLDWESLDPGERESLAQLAEHGFLVPDAAWEKARLAAYFRDIRDDTSELRVTVLTTLQCNFACDYCIQGDHGDYNRNAVKMTPEVADRTIAWVAERLDRLAPERLVVTFFGGEPLLNLPMVYRIAEVLSAESAARGVQMQINVITNGLLLTPDVVDRLLPYGLRSVKVTLDGDRAAHDRLRPLRGGQGTFDRIIENLKGIADRCRIGIGGNFDESSVDSYPALLEFLQAQPFAAQVAQVAFKPIIRPRPKPRSLPVLGDGDRPLGGTCMTATGSGGSPCDSCQFLDDKMTFLREQTRQHGFPTHDGVHMGPCELHRRHAHTIGPDGSLYACPGFTGEAALSVGHIDGRADAVREQAAAEFEAHAPWTACGDCSFVPVCGGGCSVAAHVELGDKHRPSCHKSSFEAGVDALARDAYRSLGTEGDSR